MMQGDKKERMNDVNVVVYWIFSALVVAGCIFARTVVLLLLVVVAVVVVLDFFVGSTARKSCHNPRNTQ